jgi:hypothetical protein
LFATKGNVSATFLCTDANGKTTVLWPSFTDETKNEALAIIRAYMELNGIVRYLCISECWSDIPENETEAAQLSEWLEQHDGNIVGYPNRKDLVMFYGEDETCTSFATRSIIRKPGRKPRLGPLKFLDGLPEGRMTGMIGRRNPTTH